MRKILTGPSVFEFVQQVMERGCEEVVMCGLCGARLGFRLQPRFVYALGELGSLRSIVVCVLSSF